MIQRTKKQSAIEILPNMPSERSDRFSYGGVQKAETPWLGANNGILLI